ncbi:hypothetical protein [Actinophytocola sp.]|uniref:hypothetical protein n=1 Tax=Actinophytocola sp. TaxID=1872138 RepID=UPI002ED3AAA0
MKKLIVPLFAALLVFLVGCGATDGGGTDTAGGGTGATDDAAPPQQEAEPTSRDVKFGETAKASRNDSEWAITVSAPEDHPDFVEPPYEGKYVSIQVEVTLLDGVGGAVAAPDFTLTDAAGNDYTFAAPNGIDTNDQLFATLLVAGDSEKGFVVFDVPVDPGNIVVKLIPVTETKDFATWS